MNKPIKPDDLYIGPDHIFPSEVKKPKPKGEQPKPEIYY